MMATLLIEIDDIDRIFDEPAQWGLRGDPGLWQSLKDRCKQIQQPSTATEFIDSIKRHLSEYGVSHDSDPSDMPYFEAFDKGGMSGGMISIRWWLDIGLPLLESRVSAVIAEKGAIGDQTS